MNRDATSHMLPPLGVGSLLGAAFSLVFTHFRALFLLGAIPATLSAVLSVWVYGPAVFNTFLAITDPGAFASMTREVSPTAQILVTAAGVAIWSVAAAMTSLGAFLAATQGRVTAGTALSGALSQIVPVLICGVVSYVALVLGLILLIVPGLLIAAVWYVLIPAIVIERIGPQGFGRSARLTKDYRWPIIGMLILYSLILLLITALYAGAVSVITSKFGMGAGLAIGLNVAAGAVSYAFGGALSVLTYMRLCEIKEGHRAEDLDQVFG